MLNASSISEFPGNGEQNSAKATLGTILYVGGFELPDRNAAAQRVTANAKIFRALGYRVLLLGVTHQRSWPGGAPQPVEAGGEGMIGFEVPYPAGMKAWLHRISSPGPAAEVLRRAGVTDLVGVICYNHPAVAQARIAALAHSHGAWAAADCTEWYAPSRMRGVASLIRNLDIPLRMRFVNKRMDALITTSPFISDYYRRAGQPIVEIPTLMDPPVLAPADLMVKRTGGVTKLFFAGSGFDPAQVRNSTDGLKDRLDWVFEALDAAHMHGAKFDLNLYGLDRDQYLALFPEHEPLLARLDGMYHFHGRCPRAELLSELTAAHFSIFFRSRTRTTLAGFPGKFSESIAFGTPVITNAMPSVAGFIEEGRSGFALDTADLAAAGARIAEVFAMDDRAIADMKSWCAQSQLFDYGRYIEPVRTWLAAIRT